MRPFPTQVLCKGSCSALNSQKHAGKEQGLQQEVLEELQVLWEAGSQVANPTRDIPQGLVG